MCISARQQKETETKVNLLLTATAMKRRAQRSQNYPISSDDNKQPYTLYNHCLPYVLQQLLAAVNFDQMKVKDLIKELQKQDPEKEVMIQQGEEYDYMKAYTVKEVELWDANAPEEDDTMDVVVIEYS